MNSQITIWEAKESNKKEKEIEQIVIENENLVRHTINTFKKKGWLANYTKTFTDEDVFQIGMIGLFKAAKGFDASKGYKFSTYAVTTIRNTISNELKKNSKKTENGYQSHDSLNIAYEEYMDEDSSVESVKIKKRPIDLEATDEYNSSKLDFELLFEKLIEMHPEKQGVILQTREILELYGQGNSWAQVARLRNTTVYQVKKKIKELKEMIPQNFSQNR